MFKTVRFATEANRPVFTVDPWNLSGSPFDTDRINPKLLTIWTATFKLIRAKTIFMMNCIVWVNSNQTKMIIIPKLCRFYSRKSILFRDVSRLLSQEFWRWIWLDSQMLSLCIKKQHANFSWRNFFEWFNDKTSKVSIIKSLGYEFSIAFRKVFSAISRQC